MRITSCRAPQDVILSAPTPVMPSSPRCHPERGAKDLLLDVEHDSFSEERGAKHLLLLPLNPKNVDTLALQCVHPVTAVAP